MEAFTCTQALSTRRRNSSAVLSSSAAMHALSSGPAEWCLLVLSCDLAAAEVGASQAAVQLAAAVQQGGCLSWLHVSDARMSVKAAAAEATHRQQ